MATIRECDALARDARDAARLIMLDAMIAGWVDMSAPLAEPLEHPGRRWHPGDVLDDLVAHRDAIARELARLRGPVVIEDQET